MLPLKVILIYSVCIYEYKTCRKVAVVSMIVVQRKTIKNQRINLGCWLCALCLFPWNSDDPLVQFGWLDSQCVSTVLTVVFLAVLLVVIRSHEMNSQATGTRCVFVSQTLSNPVQSGKLTATWDPKLCYKYIFLLWLVLTCPGDSS